MELVDKSLDLSSYLRSLGAGNKGCSKSGIEDQSCHLMFANQQRVSSLVFSPKIHFSQTPRNPSSPLRHSRSRCPPDNLI